MGVFRPIKTNNMKYFSSILIIVCLFFISQKGTAQQDALYSQYMFNPLALNPAYAGTRSTLSGVMLYRNQWVGMDGAPQTASIAVHSPIKGKNFALGLNLMSETIGPTQNNVFLGTYAYHINAGKGKLSFGLRGGFYSTSIDYNKLHYVNEQGKVGGRYQKSSANFDFGMYYHTDRFYGGIAISHLGNPKVKFKGSDALLPLQAHYLAFIGNAFVINENLVIKPSAVVRYTKGAPFNYDVNTSVLFQKVLWLGVSYRSNTSKINEASLVFVTEYNITESFRLGYSYDFNLGAIKRYNSGSHEIFLGADLFIKRKTSLSPRFL